ncbi:hypothetical protein [Neochlamydia sp. S13]|uniref:hypothetical protein n=1 Tax=Neochlamydia sp. S13 TaxID=1353976 RepID=UPI0005A6BA19|nr:hypothetical protein [Neochlamydia sp. S13]BBI16897.1 hypothetical protein NCS13_1_0702 [Neochlamydia sp. S13]
MHPINAYTDYQVNAYTGYQVQPVQIMRAEEIQSELELFLDNNGIISVSECQKKTCEELAEFFEVQVNEFSKGAEAAKAILNDTKNSLDYSQCMSEAEKNVENMNNILNALRNKQASVTIFETRYEEIKKALQAMRSTIPLGQSIFLRKDMEMINTIRSIPQEKVYTSLPHGNFYEPQVPTLTLASWFQKYFLNKCYEGVSVGRKLDRIYSHELNTMCTLIGLKKKKTKEDEAHDKKPFTTSPKKQIKGSSTTTESRKEAHQIGRPLSNLMTAVSTKASSVFSFKLGKEKRHGKEMILEDKKIWQENTLAHIKHDLSEMLGKWNYSHFEVGTSEDLINKYHISPDLASEADYIILFHKKYE